MPICTMCLPWCRLFILGLGILKTGRNSDWFLCVGFTAKKEPLSRYCEKGVDPSGKTLLRGHLQRVPCWSGRPAVKPLKMRSASLPLITSVLPNPMAQHVCGVSNSLSRRQTGFENRFEYFHPCLHYRHFLEDSLGIFQKIIIFLYYAYNQAH